MTHPFLSGLKPTLHIAHRGGAALAPENTLAAFGQAVQRYQTDMLELDLQLTRDGVLVVAHDGTVDRCTNGSGRIIDLSLQELLKLDAGFRFQSEDGSFPFRGQGVRVPLFREVLRAFPGLRMNVELKPDAAGAEQLLAELLRAENATTRVCVGSESDAVGARLWQAIPEACHFYPSDAAAAFVLSVKAEESIPADERFTILDLPLWFGDARVFDPSLRDAAHRRGKWINVWTVDDREQMELLVKEKVGGIMTDRPDVLRQVLTRVG